MGVLWLWASDVGLRVLHSVLIGSNQSPIIVQMARESRIWVSILWLGSSNIGLRVLLTTKLNVSPVIVQVGRKGGVRMCILGHRSSLVRSRVLLLTSFSVKLHEVSILLKSIHPPILRQWLTFIVLRIIVGKSVLVVSQLDE